MKNNPSKNNVVQSAARWRSCHAGMVGGAEMKQFEYVKVYIVMTDRGLVDHLRQPQLEEDKSVGRVLRVLPFTATGPEVLSIMQEVFGTDLEFEDAMRASCTKSGFKCTSTPMRTSLVWPEPGTTILRWPSAGLYLPRCLSHRSRTYSLRPALT